MNPPHQSDHELVVLHALRCMGYAGEQRIATAVGVGAAETTATLQTLARSGLVSLVDDPFGEWGWKLTELGRETDAAWLAAELHATGSREQVMQSFDAFLDLNTRLLAVCHAWQVREIGGFVVGNDHRDHDYDFGVIDRLAAVDRSVQPILLSLSSALARFSTYRRRLGDAMQRVDAGDHGFFTDGLDSYHTVWFQLHEDLLSTLGIERWSEN